MGNRVPLGKALTYKFAVLPTDDPSFLRALRSLGEVDTTVGLDGACVKLPQAGTFLSALARSPWIYPWGVVTEGTSSSDN